MSNFKKTNVGANVPRIELHDILNLTGAEVTVNNLPANGSVPFVHSHKKNEELYFVISGNGQLYIDGEILELHPKDCFVINPLGKRAIKAGDSGLSFICIQVKEGSLEGFTMNDGIINEEKAPWMK